MTTPAGWYDSTEFSAGDIVYYIGKYGDDRVYGIVVSLDEYKPYRLKYPLRNPNTKFYKPIWCRWQINQYKPTPEGPWCSYISYMSEPYVHLFIQAKVRELMILEDPQYKELFE